jgi:putative transposase
VREVRADLRQRPASATGVPRRRACPGDKWHLDEMFVRINGTRRYLWRAVDQHGIVLDILVTSRRDTKAAIRFFHKLLKGLAYVPKLRSYGAARHRVLRSVEHRQSKYLNNRAENSHQPTRQRERAMKKFTSAEHAQRFLSAFSGISPHFRPGRHRLSAEEYRHEMIDRSAVPRRCQTIRTSRCPKLDSYLASPRPVDAANLNDCSVTSNIRIVKKLVN